MDLRDLCFIQEKEMLNIRKSLKFVKTRELFEEIQQLRDMVAFKGIPFETVNALNKELVEARTEIEKLKSGTINKTHSGSFGFRSTSAGTTGFTSSKRTDFKSPAVMKKTFISDFTSSEPPRTISPNHEEDRHLKQQLDQLKKELDLAAKQCEAERREKESLREEIAKHRSQKQKFNKSDLDAMNRELDQLKKSRDLDEKRH